ncbi:hypothetical protein PSPO01_11107 [Paraphaeosphaeria sporulosa]
MSTIDPAHFTHRKSLILDIARALYGAHSPSPKVFDVITYSAPISPARTSCSTAGHRCYEHKYCEYKEAKPTNRKRWRYKK